VAGFVDIHSHVLPGIDDGPPELDGALAMAAAAAAAGTVTLVATPHVRSDFPDVHLEEVARRVQDLQDAITMDGTSLRIVAGAEVSLRWALEADDEQLALASYNHSGTDLLIETPNDVSQLPGLLFRLRVRGKRITLAHPERSPEFQRNPSDLHQLVEQGVLLQVNADALLRSQRAPHTRLARCLCVEGLAHVIASDGHRAERWRPVTSLADGVRAAAALVGGERATWLAQSVPEAIVAGSPIPLAPPIVPRSRLTAWRRRGRTDPAG
jgi:protein-tyrosine phosphatase